MGIEVGNVGQRWTEVNQCGAHEGKYKLKGCKEKAETRFSFTLYVRVNLSSCSATVVNPLCKHDRAD